MSEKEHDEPNFNLATLFRDDSDPISDHGGDDECIEVKISSIDLSLTCVPKDGTTKVTLFASNIWNGATQISEWLANHVEDIKDRSVVELGAASGLPSLIACCLGSSFTLATDYPDNILLQNIERNISRNTQTIRRQRCQSDNVDGHHKLSTCLNGEHNDQDRGDEVDGEEKLCDLSERIRVVGHKWGSSTFDLCQLIPLPPPSPTPAPTPASVSASAPAPSIDPSGAGAGTGPGKNQGSSNAPTSTGTNSTTSAMGGGVRCLCFDLVLAAECLWLHDQHRSLLSSIHGLLTGKRRQQLGGDVEEVCDWVGDRHCATDTDRNRDRDGIALVSFSHHVPGCEADDDNFFTLARSAPFNFEIELLETREMNEIFTTTKLKEQYLYKLTLKTR